MCFGTKVLNQKLESCKNEASTKPHVRNLIHEFLINMAFIMACPNFKKGLKMVSGPLGIKPSQY
jgi:hypothetical protein